MVEALIAGVAAKAVKPWVYRVAAVVGTVIVVAMSAVAVFSWLGEQGAKRNLTAMTSDRDSLITLGEKICGVVGEPLKAPKRAEWGQTCFARVVTLQAFRNKASDDTSKALVGHLQDQLAKSQADTARAERDKRLAFEALDALAQEAANVPETNHVGPGCYGALNRTAGLRDAPHTAPAEAR